MVITELKKLHARSDPGNVIQLQVEALRAVFRSIDSDSIREPLALLKRCNGILWRLEDMIRRSEAEGKIGSEFIAAARLICRVNDRRMRAKRAIDEALGLESAQVKIYSHQEG